MLSAHVHTEPQNVGSGNRILEVLIFKENTHGATIQSRLSDDQDGAMLNIRSAMEFCHFGTLYLGFHVPATCFVGSRLKKAFSMSQEEMPHPMPCKACCIYSRIVVPDNHCSFAVCGTFRSANALVRQPYLVGQSVQALSTALAPLAPEFC